MSPKLRHMKSECVQHSRPKNGLLRTITGLRQAESGLSLVELLIAVGLVGLLYGTILTSYMSTAIRLEWTGDSLAAQACGVKCLEQARSAVWDPALGKNEVTNLNLVAYSWNAGTLTLTGYTTNIVDIPYKGTNYLLATNFITIQTVTENNSAVLPVQLQMLRVDTVWPFSGWGGYSVRLYTNTIITYIAPDNRDPSTLGGSH